MNSRKLIVSIIFMLASLLGFSQSDSGFKRLNVQEFKAKIKTENSKVILDVRTPQEYKNGHLKNARLLNYYDKNFKSQLKKLDQDKTYFVYCASGNRSQRAAKALAKLGFDKIYELKGGFNAWQKNN